MEKRLEKIISLSKRKGFIYPGSEIYGGLAGTWDYGPLGVELKNRIREIWWKHFVYCRDDMLGIDSAIIMHPRVWLASGHVGGFADVLIDCKKCKNRFQADHLIEEQTQKDVEGKNLKEIDKIISEEKIKCPVCRAQEWTDVRKFDLLLKTYIGAVEDSKSLTYLRGETAQGMFTNFKNIIDSFHPKIPFGIAQIGRVFRNEIAPRDFLFRTREFEIAELEYFIHPKADWQKIFEQWLDYINKFAEKIGIDSKKLKFHEIPEEKRAHYSKRTVDIGYSYPFGNKELWAIAYRTDYDLKNHIKESKIDLNYTDEASGEKFVPHVIEPTFGVDRTFLALMCEAYDEDELGGEKRIVLRFKPEIAPVKLAIFPLLRNKPKLVEKAKEVYKLIRKEIQPVVFDDNGNIGKRYRRQDEIGTPFCLTIDFKTLENNTVTIRDRDTGEQERLEIKYLAHYFKKFF